MVIDDLSSLSSPELNTSVASVIYKGKDKPLTQHKSYRLVRITPLLTRLIEEYLRPHMMNIISKTQNSSQYGFTKNMSYLMGVLQRYECEQYCLDKKRTFFSCSLDGDSAFEVVNRSIQKRELFMSGIQGEAWLASHHSYTNSKTKIKMKSKLSAEINEELGVKQGNIQSSDHYKIYNNPCLDMLDNSELGVSIGPINCSNSTVADDIFIHTDDQYKLQVLINIAEKYGYTYRVSYGASKTNITFWDKLLVELIRYKRIFISG